MSDLKNSIFRDLREEGVKNFHQKGKESPYRSFNLRIREGAISPMTVAYQMNSKAKNWVRSLSFSVKEKNLESVYFAPAPRRHWFLLPSTFEAGELFGVGYHLKGGLFRERYLVLSEIRKTSLCFELLCDFSEKLKTEELIRHWRDWESYQEKMQDDSLDREYRERLAREK